MLQLFTSHIMLFGKTVRISLLPDQARWQVMRWSGVEDGAGEDIQQSAAEELPYAPSTTDDPVEDRVPMQATEEAALPVFCAQTINYRNVLQRFYDLGSPAVDLYFLLYCVGSNHS